jgi:transcriptional regulator with XRE-family HTH domain
MAEVFGVTHSTLSQWENGKTTPELQNLIAVAETYEVSIDWLVFGGDVSSGIESRIRKVHPTLRGGLVERLHKEIDETLEAEKRLPKEMLTTSVVKDADHRLDGWSAKGKRVLPPPKDN